VQTVEFQRTTRRHIPEERILNVNMFSCGDRPSSVGSFELIRNFGFQ
jgi:hypothetical protein